MTLPLTALITEHRELGLIVAVLLGFCFGFVLERAGFGRADKLAAQFYLYDMTVFKVMFGAIVTAMLGVLLAAGAGLVDLRAISQSVASETFLWPMIVGGLLLGVGFIVSGYCPGTSIVAMASGRIDGLVTVLGVVIGTVVFSEAYPWLSSFHLSGAKGHLFLYDWLGLPPLALGLMVTVAAIGAFIGAEKVEGIFSRRRGLPGPHPQARPQRRLAFGLLGVLAALGLGTLALPRMPRAAPEKPVHTIEQAELGRRLLDQPWSLRLLDLRDRAACATARLPGAECTPAAMLDKLGLAYNPGTRDLVLVGDGELTTVPPAALTYPGRVFKLRQGFAGWRRFALEKPALPGEGADAEARAAYQFRAALHAAMTGRKPPPPPPAAAGARAPAKKKGGGCS